MRARLFVPVCLIVSLVALAPTSATAQPRATVADRLIIVAGRTSLSRTISGVLAQDQYWVVLGGITPQGEAAGPGRSRSR